MEVVFSVFDEAECQIVHNEIFAEVTQKYIAAR